MRRAGGVFVVGVGNILWADEGFGVRCVEALARDYVPPDGAAFVDGGTQGLALVNDLAEASRILIFDAVDFDGAPGELVVARGDDVPRFAAGKKVSLHQTSMMEILAVSEFMAGGPPEEIVLIGCQPSVLEDYGGGLTPLVSACVEPAVETALAELERWGAAPRRRCGPDVDGYVAPPSVARDAYESGRPSPQDACRIGDARVLERVSVQER